MIIDRANKKFRQNLANQYTELAKLLKNINVDSSPITRAIGELKKDDFLPLSTPTSWGYSIRNLTFRQKPINDIQYPNEGNLKSVKISLDLTVNGEYNENNPNLDPFQNLEFNLVIEGLTKRDIKHILCFHLDRHPDNSPSDHAHPVYHMHVGGHRLKSYSGKNFGNAMFMGSPRIKHYPMDLILGIDFITSNFCPEVHKTLRKEQAFIKLLKNSQERILKPYYGSLSNYFGFNQDTSNTWKANKIFPQLI